VVLGPTLMHGCHELAKTSASALAGLSQLEGTGLRDHPASTGAMRQVHRQPPPPLAPFMHRASASAWRSSERRRARKKQPESCKVWDTGDQILARSVQHGPLSGQRLSKHSEINVDWAHTRALKLPLGSIWTQTAHLRPTYRPNVGSGFLAGRRPLGYWSETARCRAESGLRRGGYPALAR
jgi:hypothetical protein